MVEVKCETDFVARGDKFKEFADAVVRKIADTRPRHLERSRSSGHAERNHRRHG